MASAASGVVAAPPLLPTSTVSVTSPTNPVTGSGTQTGTRNSPPAAEGSPIVSEASLSGVAQGRPRLTFMVTAGADAPLIKALSITLPKGLRLASSRKALERGVRVRRSGTSRMKFTVAAKQGVLTVTLADAVAKVQVTVSSPELTVLKTLAAAAKAGKARAIPLAIRVTDTTRKATPLAVKLRPR